MIVPIKPENRALYPADWKAISLAARERAGWRCQHEGCLAHQYAVGWWRQTVRRYEWLPEWPRDGAYMGQTYADARAVAAGIYFAAGESGPKPTIIVLTVAHLNHQPEDCRPQNLAAMCQRHHLAYDAEHHAQTAYATRKARARTAEMF
jgi:hypothetical protein